MAFKIRRGEDISIPVNITYDNKRPFDLTGWTKITAEFKKSDNEILSQSTEPANGIFSSAEYEGVTYTADEVGTIGNSISLVFDGNDDIDTVVDAWNTSNPSNTVSSDASDGTVVPSAGTVNLSGGEEPEPEIDVVDDKLGEISIKLNDTETSMLRLGNEQSIKLLIDFQDHPEGKRRIAVINRMIDVEEVYL